MVVDQIYYGLLLTLIWFCYSDQAESRRQRVREARKRREERIKQKKEEMLKSFSEKEPPASSS